MGDVYTDLVPAAILLDCNGLTREEFSRKLLDFSDYHFSFNVGLHNVATELGLPYTSKYKQFLESINSMIDSNGLKLYANHLDTQIMVLDDNFDKYIKLDNVRYTVSRHIKNILCKKKLVDEEFVYSEIREGEIYSPWHGGCSRLVTRVFDIKKVVDENFRESSFEFNQLYTAKLEVRDIKTIRDIQTFNNLDDLIKTFPEYDPDNMFDFSKESGSMNLSGYYTNKFYWVRKGDKYFLDEYKTFNSMPASRIYYEDKFGVKHNDFGYTDLILTTEALKKGFFALVNIGPKNYTAEFFKIYPDSKKRYDNSVRGSHISLFAKSAGWTNSELLRYRMLGMIPGTTGDKLFYDPSCDHL